MQPLALPTPDTASCWTTVSPTHRTGCGANIVQGRGREFAHATHQHGPREAPTVSFDYARIGDKGDVTSQDQTDIEEGSVKVLNLRESASKAVFGHVVPRKGIDEKGFAVDAIVEDAEWLGYTKIMLDPEVTHRVLEGAQD